MESKRIIIGRDTASCDIKIDQSFDTVSNNHAVITLEGNSYTFTDNSSNGTLINGKKVHNKSVVIQPGDTIALAGTVIVRWEEIEQLLPMPKIPVSRPTVQQNIQPEYTQPAPQPVQPVQPAQPAPQAPPVIPVVPETPVAPEIPIPAQQPVAPAPQPMPQPTPQPVAPAPQPIPQPVQPVQPAPQPVQPAPQPMQPQRPVQGFEGKTMMDASAYNPTPQQPSTPPTAPGQGAFRPQAPAAAVVTPAGGATPPPPQQPMGGMPQGNMPPGYQGQPQAGAYRSPVVQQYLKKFNIGAFLMGPWWAIFHKVWIGLIAFFVPFFPIYLGIKGSELAWEKDERKDLAAFIQKQKTWMLIGIICSILTIILLIIFVFCGAAISSISNMH